MKPEIKQKIEQINSGNVPNGYKKTKVGIIPTDWEITRFKKKFDRLMRKNAEGNTNVLTISAQFGLVNQEDFFNKSVASDDKSNYYLLNRGEYAYNKSYSNGYPFGAIKRLDKYEKGIVSPLYICFSAGKGNECPEFYLQYFEAGRLNSEIHAFAQEGARNHGLLNISIDDFFNSIMIDPPLPEQEKISQILTAQDRVIKLYEEKIKQLKKLKKAFLQKMFPKPGATVPEWRFPGFTDAWEQRKVGECFSERVESDPNGELISVTIGSGIKKFSELGRHDNSNDDKSKYKKVVIGDIAYNSMRMWQGASGYSPYNGIVSPAYTVITPFSGIDSKFFAYMFKREDMIHTFQVRSQGITSDNWNLKFPALSEIEVMLPTDISEQKSISTYLTTLDDLITLHQRKCDEEKQKKKALMQLLLTGIVRVRI